MTKRVLIADDAHPARQSLSAYLADHGYEIEQVADGEQARDVVCASRFDAVLLGLRMPEMRRFDVLSAMAQAHPTLPIVALSDTAGPDDVLDAIRCGAWDYISRPIGDLDAVGVVLERVLERARRIGGCDHERGAPTGLSSALEAEVRRQTADLRNQNRLLAAMNRVAHAVSHAFELDTMLDRALGAVLAALGAEAALVQLLNPTTARLYVAAARGFAEGEVPLGHASSVSAGLTGRVVQDGHVKIGLLTAPDACIPGLDLRGYASYALVPLHASDTSVYWEHERSRQVIVGLLGVFSTQQDAFQPDELELLNGVGNQLGLAVTRAQYAADLRRANLQLETANQELKRLDALREQFIQNVTHELRTPLALVRGYVELLADGGLAPDNWASAIGVARKRVIELVDLVEAITTLQDLDSEPLTIDPLSVRELVRTACRMTEQRAASSDVRIQVGTLGGAATIPGDFSRLVRALHQILDNACKFSEAGTQVTVSTSLSADKRFLQISVVDQGIGIPESELERIFARFYQVDGSATRRYGGTGLGLALARETLEAHEGWIRVESEVGVGSTFILGIPRGADAG